jgi:hypothetical protein
MIYYIIMDESGLQRRAEVCDTIETFNHTMSTVDEKARLTYNAAVGKYKVKYIFDKDKAPTSDDEVESFYKTKFPELNKLKGEYMIDCGLDSSFLMMSRMYGFMRSAFSTNHVCFFAEYDDPKEFRRDESASDWVSMCKHMVGLGTGGKGKDLDKVRSYWIRLMEMHSQLEY